MKLCDMQTLSPWQRCLAQEQLCKSALACFNLCLLFVYSGGMASNNNCAFWSRGPHKIGPAEAGQDGSGPRSSVPDIVAGFISHYIVTITHFLFVCSHGEAVVATAARNLRRIRLQASGDVCGIFSKDCTVVLVNDYIIPV